MAGWANVQPDQFRYEMTSKCVKGLRHQPVKYQRNIRMNNSDLWKGLVMDTDPRKIFDNVIAISITLGKCPRKLGENTQITNYWNKSCSCRFLSLVSSNYWFEVVFCNEITLLGAWYPWNKMQITRPSCTASRQICHSWSLWVGSTIFSQEKGEFPQHTDGKASTINVAFG